MQQYLITFTSTHQALRVEKLLKKKTKVQIVPTPREISSECGFSLLCGEIDPRQMTFENQGIENIYHVNLLNGGKQYEKVS